MLVYLYPTEKMVLLQTNSKLPKLTRCFEM